MAVKPFLLVVTSVVQKGRRIEWSALVLNQDSHNIDASGYGHCTTGHNNSSTLPPGVMACPFMSKHEVQDMGASLGASETGSRIANCSQSAILIQRDENPKFVASRSPASSMGLPNRDHPMKELYSKEVNADSENIRQVTLF
jgi:hypothetical protein